MYAYDLGDSWTMYVYCTQGIAENANVEAGYTLERYLRDCEAGDTDHTEWIAGWDIVPTLRVAEEGYTGRCRVWHQPHYYAGHCDPPRAQYARVAEDEEGNEVVGYDGDEIREFASPRGRRKVRPRLLPRALGLRRYTGLQRAQPRAERRGYPNHRGGRLRREHAATATNRWTLRTAALSRR